MGQNREKKELEEEAKQEGEIVVKLLLFLQKDSNVSVPRGARTL